MVTSCTGHVLENQRATTRGDFSSGSHLVTLYFQPHPFFSCVTDAVNGARSRFSAFYPKANYGLQGSQPSDVRAHNRAANGACDEYKQLKVLSMGRQKAVIKARREAKLMPSRPTSLRQACRLQDRAQQHQHVGMSIRSPQQQQAHSDRKSVV